MNDTTASTTASTTKPAKAPKAAKPKEAAAKKPAPKAGAKAPAKKAAPAKQAKPKAPKVEGGSTTDALREKAPGYVHDKEHKTASGNPSIHCGDDVAKKLLGKDLDAVYAMAAKVCEVPEKELRAKYAHLNVGMQRMNLGNKMRGVLNAK